MKIDELKKVLREIDVRPSRKLGQNFLCDEEAAEWIAGQLGAGAEDTVIEVGPGTGALTEHLEGKVRRLVAMEKDPRLATYLKYRFQGEGVEVKEGDALETDLRPWYARQPLKLIGNLPYSAGGEILRLFLAHGSPVGRAVIMVQKEVAARLAAGPGTKSYGLLSLRVQSSREVTILRDFGPECFYPEPQVDSTVVLLTPRPGNAFVPFDRRRFDKVVRRGFSQRRKQLRKLLEEAKGNWGEITAKLGVSEKVRGEELTLEKWITLTNLLDPAAPAEVDATGEEVFDVVDKTNTVTGQAPRAEVHEKGLRHRAVHIFLFNKNGELFLQKRSHLKDRHPEVWDSSAAGHLDAGEDYAEAAVRELGEELGLEVGAADFEEVARLDACEETGQEFIRLYSVKAEGRPRWAPTEIDYGNFFSMEVVREWVEARPEDFAPGFVECLKMWTKSRV